MPLADPMDQRSENVTVAVRLRPLADPAEDINDTYTATATEVIVRDPLSRGRHEHRFEFNRIFMPEHGQAEVFDFVAKPLLDHLLQGFNSCCFAYGQTGSGKTHSVFGEGNSGQRGMLARSIEYLFERIEQVSVIKEVGMAVSFTEIYLDQVRDLGRFYLDKKKNRRTSLGSGSAAGDEEASPTSPGSSKIGRRQSLSKPSRTVSEGDSDSYVTQDLEIRESALGHVYVEDLSLIPVSNIREVLEVANLGVKMRATYETKLNARSSRSHTIFTVSIALKDRIRKQNAEAGIVTSSINFVDLAGSERLARSQSEGRRFHEAVVINTSLSALGKVVLALASSHRSHIPYRDSKLTRILQNSLGGTSFTTLLTTIDPSAHNYEESLNSLLFADRCKSVQNRPTVAYSINEADAANQRVVADLVEHVAKLRRALQAGSRILDPAGFLGQADSNEATRPAKLGGGAGTAGGAAAGGGRAEVSSGVAFMRERWRRAEEVSGKTHSAGSSGPGSSVWKPKDRKDEKLLEQLRAAQDRREQDAAHTRQLHRKAEAAEANVDQSWHEFYERDLERRQAGAATRRLNQELEREVAAQQSYFDRAQVELTAKSETELCALQDSATEVLCTRGRVLEDLPDEFTEDPRSTVAVAVLTRRLDVAAEAEQRHCSRTIQGQEDSVASDFYWVSKVHGQRLRIEEAEAERLTSELEEAREVEQRERRVLQGDLIEAFDVASQLRTLLAELQAGLPATGSRSGVQPPEWPLADLQAALASNGRLSAAELEQLHSSGSELRREITKYRRATAGGCAVAASGATAPASPSGVPLERSWASDATNLPAAAAAGSGGAATAACGSGAVVADGAWDAEDFARQFCLATSGGSGEPSLQHLGTERLRCLGLALWRRARMSTQALEGETLRLREVVSKELSEHSRVQQILQLERDIAATEVRLKAEEESNRQVAAVVKLCAVAAVTVPCRPGSGGQRCSGGSCLAQKVACQVAGSGARAVLAAKAAVHGGLQCRPASAGPRCRLSAVAS